MRSVRLRRAGCRRCFSLKKGDAGRAQTRLIFSTYRNSCFFAAARLVIRLGDGTADLQVEEGGATGGRRPPRCPVIYRDTSINISGLQLGSYSEFSLMFVVKLLFTLCLRWAVSVRFMELTFSFGSFIISD